MSGIESFAQFAQTIGARVLLQEPLSRHTSFCIGGAAQLFLEPKNIDQLKQLLRKAAEWNVEIFTFGKGSNLLVSDNGIKGAVIHIGEELSDISSLSEDTFVVCSGIKLAKLCSFALDNSLTGLEFAYGIPGTLGGAIYMNAGAYDGDMSNVVLKCEHITSNGISGSFNYDELKFGYRTSSYKNTKNVITRATISLKKGDYEEIREKMTRLVEQRKQKQPLEFPSAGSVFKRPEGYFAGTMIEQCGLKGFKIGGAEVSEKHAGFIVNRGGATATDVLHLIEHIKKTILCEFGIELETEICFVGE